MQLLYLFISILFLSGFYYFGQVALISFKFNENKYIKLLNLDGYLSILVNYKNKNEKIKLIYKNEKLQNYITFQILSGSMLILIFLFVLIKSILIVRFQK